MQKYYSRLVDLGIFKHVNDSKSETYKNVYAKAETSLILIDRYYEALDTNNIENQTEVMNALTIECNNNKYPHVARHLCDMLLYRSF